jgi:hypothetical protein
MKTLSKDPNSPILLQGWVYKEQSKNDLKLKAALIQEQKGFCAYTEAYIKQTDKTHIEHFDPTLKHRDNYYNYYAVIPWANFSKLGKTYSGSLFFQDPRELEQRIGYENGSFVALNDEDHESKDLIEFLGFNEPELFDDRRDHILRLREHFEVHCKGSKEKFKAYLARHRHELSFPTAIEAEFNIDLTDIIQQS